MSTVDDYVLGHGDPELARLQHQARLMAPATRAILRLAGVAPGMRVLDLGTGPGDVALAAAELVGTDGEVVGIDREEKALRLARQRARAQGLPHVTFHLGDVTDWRGEGQFDVIVGRLILLYCPEPAAVIRHHIGSLTRGGRYVAMEYDMVAARAEPPCPTADRATGWVVEAFRRAGMDPSLGVRLGTILTQAGLTSPTVLGFQPYVHAATDGAQALAGIIATLLPLIERTGVADPAEVDITTLHVRLAAELAAAEAAVVMPTLVGAWTGPTP